LYKRVFRVIVFVHLIQVNKGQMGQVEIRRDIAPVRQSYLRLAFPNRDKAGKVHPEIVPAQIAKKVTFAEISVGDVFCAEGCQWRKVQLTGALEWRVKRGFAAICLDGKNKNSVRFVESHRFVEVASPATWKEKIKGYLGRHLSS